MKGMLGRENSIGQSSEELKLFVEVYLQCYCLWSLRNGGGLC